MSALSIDFAPQYQGIEQEKLADILTEPAAAAPVRQVIV